jgi:hypothetical protein
MEYGGRVVKIKTFKLLGKYISFLLYTKKTHMVKVAPRFFHSGKAAGALI